MRIPVTTTRMGSQDSDTTSRRPAQKSAGSRPCVEVDFKILKCHQKDAGKGQVLRTAFCQPHLSKIRAGSFKDRGITHLRFERRKPRFYSGLVRNLIKFKDCLKDRLGIKR